MADGLGTAVSGAIIDVDEDDGTVRVDPASGNIERDQDDGGVIIQFNALSKADSPQGFHENLAKHLEAAELGKIANDLFEAIDADDRSRKGYLDVITRAMTFLGLEMKEPRAVAGDTSAAVEGQSQVTNPLLLEACLKSWANSQGELLPAEGPVKVDIGIGEAAAAEDDLAEALERDFNYYLTDTATEYYPDTSHMLLWGVHFKGSGFKKVYSCLRRRRPVSDSVDAADLIVSDTTRDLKSCERITHQIRMRPSDLHRMVQLGAYRETSLTQPYYVPDAVESQVGEIQGTQRSTRPEDQPYTVWECQCELDLPRYTPKQFKGTNVRLPYIVTLEKDSRTVLAVRRDWREDDEQCERKRMYVRYPYVPGPGFYGTGMIGIVGNCSMAMTAAWREALDAGMFANFPSGTIAKIGGRQNTSDMRLSPGMFQPVETGGLPINHVVAPLPYRDVTPGLLALMDKVTQQAKEVGGVADLPAGEGIQNVPVGTMLANIEQATKVISASHKGMHQAQCEELELLADLFRENPTDFWSRNKICPQGFWDEQKFLQALNNCHLRPRSDPNTPSHLHRIAVALGLVQMASNPVFTAYFNLKELVMRTMRVIRVDPAGLIQDPPPIPPEMMNQGKPGPDPLVGQARMLQAQTDVQEAQSKAQLGQQQVNLGQQKLQTQRDIASAELAREMVIHQRDTAKDMAQNASDMRQSAIEGARQAHLDAMQQAHDRDQDMHDRMIDMAKLAHDRGGAVADNQMDVAKLAHERQRDMAEHALNVHEVLHPPQPATQRWMGGRVNELQEEEDMKQVAELQAATDRLAEQISKLIELQTAPRVITRDSEGRFTGIQVVRAAPEPAPKKRNRDGSVTVKVD
jgi:hypothetical protein